MRGKQPVIGSLVEPSIRTQAAKNSGWQWAKNVGLLVSGVRIVI